MTTTRPATKEAHAELVKRLQAYCDEITTSTGCDMISIIVVWANAEGPGLHAVTDVGNLDPASELYDGLRAAHSRVEAAQRDVSGMTRQ